MSYQLGSRRSGPVTRSRSRSRGRQVGSPRVFNKFDSFEMQKQQPERTSRRPRRLTKEPDPDYTPIKRRSRSRARNVFTNRQEDSSKPIPATFSCGTGVPGNKNHPVIMDVEEAGASPDIQPRRVPVNKAMMMDCYVELATEGNKRGGTSTKSVSKKRLMEESPPSFDSKKRKSVGPGNITEESRTSGSLDQFPSSSRKHVVEETRRISASCDDLHDGENSSSALVAVLDLDDGALMGDVKYDDDPVVIEMDCQLNEDSSAKIPREEEPENIQLSGSNNKLSKEKALEGSECVKKKYSFCVIL